MICNCEVSQTKAIYIPVSTVAFTLLVFAQKPDDGDPKKNQKMSVNHNKCTAVLG